MKAPSGDQMPNDDIVYKKNVRNASVIIVLVAGLILSLLLLPPLFLPHEQSLSRQSTAVSPEGYTLNVSLNSTVLRQDGTVTVNAWMNNTLSQVLNITGRSDWAVDPVLVHHCTSPGNPFGVLVARGVFTPENLTGVKDSIVGYLPLTCPPVSYFPPQAFFLISPHGSSAIGSFNGTFTHVLLTTESAIHGKDTTGVPLARGVYSVLSVDEWGEVAVAYFRVSG